MPEHSPIKMEKAEAKESVRAFSVPALPKHFVARPALVSEVVELLLEQEWRVKWLLRQGQRVALTSDLGGQEADGWAMSLRHASVSGGFGKSTLAMAVCHDGSIVEHYSDGIRWLTFGPQPDLLQLVNGLGRSFDAQWSGCGDINLALSELEALLKHKKVLLVLDDVWQDANVTPFLLDSAAYLMTTRWPDLATYLVTTRWPDLVALDARVVALNQMSVDEATALFLSFIGSAVPDEQPLRELATYLGRWPLLLELVAAQLVVQNQKSLPQAVALVRERLEARGLTAVDVRDEAACLSALEITLSVSLHELQALGSPSQNWRERYLELAIFPETIEIPCATIFKLWQATAGFEHYDSEKALVAMRDLSLLTHVNRVVTTSVVSGGLERLKSLLRELRDPNEALLRDKHEALLAAHEPASGKWADLPSDEPYMCRHLATHLCAAGHSKRLGELLLEFDWLEAKLEATDINGLMADYEVYLANCAAESEDAQEGSDIRQLQHALSRVAHRLAEDKSQLVGQLWGRLAHHSSAALQRLLSQAAESGSSLRLRPLTASQHTHPALIHTLRGHIEGVTELAVVGERIISATYWELKVWDLISGRNLHTFTDETQSITWIVGVAAVGERIISAHDDKTLKVWDITTGNCLHTLRGHPEKITMMAAAGERIVSASEDNTLKVWDLISGDNLHTLTTHTNEITALLLSPDGQSLISGAEDGTLKVWDLASGDNLHTLTEHSKEITALLLSPDGQRFISASMDKTIKVWQMANGHCLHTLTSNLLSTSELAITPDGQQIISANSDYTLSVSELATGQCLHTLTGHRLRVDGIFLSPDGLRIISGSADETIKIWDLASGELLNTLTGHTEALHEVVLSPDGQRIISTSWDETLKVWDLARASQINRRTGHTGLISAVAITPDGQQVISASEDKTLKIWALTSGRLLHTLTGHSEEVTAVAAIGQRIISASKDKTLKIWELASGQLLNTLTSHSEEVTAVAAIGQRIISASKDKTLKIWELASGQLLNTLTGHTKEVTAVVAVEQQIISASEDKTLKVWHLTSRQCLHTLTDHSSTVSAVAVTPDGQRIISASISGEIKEWNLASGQLIRTRVQGHNFGLSGLAPAPCGQLLISASQDQTLNVWRAGLPQEADWPAWEILRDNCLASFDMSEKLHCCAIAPDGQTVVAGGQFGRVHILRLEIGDYAANRRLEILDLRLEDWR